MKKIAFTSRGTALVKENGSTRRASDSEVAEYLKSQVPSEKKGAKLSAVKYDQGFVFAKYDNGKVFKKKIVAQNNSSQQEEPVNSGDKADPDLKTPRSEKHSKPENKQVTKDRPDVGNPKKVRKDDYERGGEKGADEHTDNIPRSKSNSGLDGSKKTTFEKEKANAATSGKPDKYVQDLYDNEDPTPAGKAENHATAGANTASASNGIQVESDSTLYSKISIAMDDEDKDKDEKPTPSWLKNKKDKGSNKDDKEKDKEKDGDEEDDDDESDSKKEAKLAKELNVKIAELNKTIKTLKAETNRYKCREARQIPALKLALAFRDANPEQFPTVESIADKVVDLCKKMNTDAIEETYEQVKAIRLANSKKNKEQVKTASLNEGVSTTFSTPLETISDANMSNFDTLKEALMGNTALGRQMAEIDMFEKSEKNKYGI